MASSAPGDHQHAFGFTGMRRVGANTHSVFFACDGCGASHAALRCVAANRDGSRCCGVARRLHLTCFGHRAQERAVRAGEPNPAVPR